ncbi:SusE outer membrane protein [Arachidicoccus rhizosphaerae]|uniref:SusE outer membrane protein n=1 Tax=Arachidicoccus rhizosphaerae TaxID=551991 RepID=A0A1H4AYJ9_9BACT|nr:SusE domain-containing protein [Arachidicoccus rhizosphaerae]SEA40940.1 SusE outer membrane protein [Arachidicoccus rhizosphaerae]
MKTIMPKIFIVLAFLSLVTGCKKSDMEYKDPKVTAVDQLYAPADNQQITLSTQAGAALLFQWAPSHAQDGQLVSYEVDFYAEADTINPVYRVASDNTGEELYANITHIDINKAASAAGIPTGETGTIYWSVSSWRGISSAVSSQKNKLIVKRLEGFEVIPDNVYVTGEGSETGDNLDKAIQMTKVSDGKFEIYTKLKAAAGYKFVDRISGTPSTYYINDDGKLAEATGDESSQVASDGIYRITVDFTNKGTTMTEIKSMGVFFSPTNSIILNLDYQGLGIWSGTTTLHLKQESWGLDERYKFQMETSAGTEQLGTKIDSDSPPDASSPASYYYVTLLDQTSQWDHKWKFNHSFDGKSITVTLLLQGTAPYTHTVK